MLLLTNFSSLQATKICIERGQRKGWLKEVSEATNIRSDTNSSFLCAEISSLHMKFFEDVSHILDKHLQKGLMMQRLLAEGSKQM